jgi:hypothetical protein
MWKRSALSFAGLGLVAATAACAGAAVVGDQPVPVAAPPSVTPSPSGVPAIADDDPALGYAQSGPAVTVTKDAEAVATVTLASADYAANSAKVVLSVEAARPFTVDPAMFTLYDLKGWENDPEQTTPVRFEAGAGSLTLTFTATPGRPEALGWVPQDGEAAVAVWERG